MSALLTEALSVKGEKYIKIVRGHSNKQVEETME